MKKIYLDQASTSCPKAPGVADAVFHYLSGDAVNINRGSYDTAFSVEEQIFDTREQLKQLFHFPDKSRNVIFTANVTASLNILLKGLLRPGDHVQSVIFCGQFNTCLSVSLPAPAFRFRSLNLSYPFPALWAIL